MMIAREIESFANLYPRWLWAALLSVVVASAILKGRIQIYYSTIFFLIAFNIVVASNYILYRSSRWGQLVDFIATYLFMPPTGIIALFLLVLASGSIFTGQRKLVLPISVQIVLSVVHGLATGLMLSIDRDV